MNKILKTLIYSSVYYDYINKTSKTDGFIDSLHRISWDEKVSSLNPSSDRYQQIKQLLLKQNSDLQSDKAKIYLEYLNQPDSVILITGQQLGLFASPIYTLYKIITTLKLAEYLNSGISSFRYVPVFWLESEDHDFKEINHIGVMDKNFQPIEMLYPGKDRDKVSLRLYQLEESISTFIAGIKANLLETEFSSDLFDNLNQYYRPNHNWISAIRQFLKQIFHSFGLLYFQPGDEEIKQISVNFFTELLQKGEEIKLAFYNQSQALLAQGYHNQVPYFPGQTYIHIEREGNQRRHLHKDRSNYFFKDSDQKYTQTEVTNLITNHPTLVSSTVVSRPLLQSWLLPVAAYIAGPGEIAYWAQLGQMFPMFDLVMPVLYPRISATLIEPKIARYLKKHSLEIETLPIKKDKFVEEYFKNLSDQKDENPIRELDHSLEREGLKLESYLKTLDPTLIDVGKKSIKRIKQTLYNLEDRVIKVREKKEGELTNHLEQIHTAFFPQEIPQERFISVIYFLNKYGPEFIERIFSNLELHNFNHQLLYL